ncbi:MAG: UPF0149 family protein [Magnetococcales bacterium]|nr:UPF0149 family protein [Magnetococcales bacterium]
MIDESLWDDLDDMLSSYEEAFTIDELCGFLYGIVITAELIHPSEWLPKVFGGEIPEFESRDEAQGVMDLLMQAYNEFISQFQSGILVFPYDHEGMEPDDFEMVENWCMGLSQGMRLRADYWLPSDNHEDMDRDEKEVTICLSIVEACSDIENVIDIFNNIQSTDPKIRLEEFDNADIIGKMFVFLPLAVENLTMIGAKKVAESTDLATPAQPVGSNSVARDQPCPCGSGKQIKECCGVASTLVH